MSKNKIPTPQEEHEEKVAETADMITAEDLVEQAVYAVNAPDCCSGGQQAANMLDMLGANIMDSSIYHGEAEHPSGYLSRVKEKLQQDGFQTFHYKDGTLGVQRGGVTLGNVGFYGEFYCDSTSLGVPVKRAEINHIMKAITEVKAEMEGQKMNDNNDTEEVDIVSGNDQLKMEM